MLHAYGRTDITILTRVRGTLLEMKEDVNRRKNVHDSGWPAHSALPFVSKNKRTAQHMRVDSTQNTNVCCTTKNILNEFMNNYS